MPQQAFPEDAGVHAGEVSGESTTTLEVANVVLDVSSHPVDIGDHPISFVTHGSAVAILLLQIMHAHSQNPSQGHFSPREGTCWELPVRFHFLHMVPSNPPHPDGVLVHLQNTVKVAVCMHDRLFHKLTEFGMILPNGAIVKSSGLVMGAVNFLPQAMFVNLFAAQDKVMG